MDVQERESRSVAAASRLDDLAGKGVVAVATTFVDNSGITRVKAVPLRRLPQLAAWGVGISTVFDRFRADDGVAGAGAGVEAVGDLRILPDVRRLVPLAGQPGWAWAPGDRYQQSGEPSTQCNRLLLQRLSDALAVRGVTVRSAFELEWVISQDADDAFVPALRGPAYGMSRLIDRSDYSRDLLQALHDEGVEVEQFHPEYAPGQLELSVAPEDPVGAADTSVLARSTIRAIGQRYGLRTSFSPKVAVPGVGNGGHVHLSIWRDGRNLMASGDGPFGTQKDGAAFCAGILSRLPALLTIGAPHPVSYLRLLPSHWAGVYACWGLENREAAVRLVTGSAGSEGWAANVEVKCFDLLANPYLVLAGLLVAGVAGLDERSELPPPVDADPAVLGDEVLAQRGIERLPTSLAPALAAFRSDATLAQAFGPDLMASIAAIRQGDIDEYADLDDANLAAATRWLH